MRKQKTKGESIMRGSRLKNGTGAIVLEKKCAIKDDFIVLCIVPKNHEYVTWYMNQEAQTFHGRYTLSLDEATQDFRIRQ